MDKRLKGQFLLCVLNTLTGIIVTAFIRIPLEGETVGTALWAGMCASIVTWTALAFMCLRRKTAWLTFLTYSVRLAAAGALVTFLASAAMAQPGMGMRHYSDILMRETFPRFLGTGIAFAVAYLAILAVMRLTIRASRRKTVK